METCFVIQPFDGGGRFDKRFEDVYAPAIKAANLDPYRVDRDPSVNIPIEEIEKGISAARVCFIDVTLDNPNVWFELGFAIASRKPVCVVCSKERTTPFPFDIRHRTIIEYDYTSVSDFTRLQDKITARLKSIVEQQETTGRLAELTPTSLTAGLQPHEVAALAIIVGCLDSEGMSAHYLQQGMHQAGFTETATGVAVASLKRKGLVKEGNGFHPDVEETWTIFLPTESGLDWLLQNQDKLDLRRPPDPPPADPF
jgi:hypothetical protein